MRIFLPIFKQVLPTWKIYVIHSSPPLFCLVPFYIISVNMKKPQVFNNFSSCVQYPFRTLKIYDITFNLALILFLREIK